MVAILAALTISNEYGSGMIRTTLAAMPNRQAVLAAKAILLAALVLAAGTVAVFGSVLAGHLILTGHGFTAVGRPRRAGHLGRSGPGPRRARVLPAGCLS